MIYIDALYLLAAVIFIFGIKGLTKIKTAKRGNLRFPLPGTPENRLKKEPTK